MGRVEGHFSPTPAVEGDGGAPGPAVGQRGVLAELFEVARQVRVLPGQFRSLGGGDQGEQFGVEAVEHVPEELVRVLLLVTPKPGRVQKQTEKS